MEIDFYGNKIITAEKNGDVYVSMKSIVEGIGLDWNTQRQKIIDDAKYGVIPILHQAGRSRQEGWFMPLKRLNGWLLSVNANRVSPKIKKKLLKYQEECFECLYDYFHKGYAINKNAIEKSPEIIDRISDEIKKLRMQYTSIYRKLTDAMVITSKDEYERMPPKDKSALFARIQDNFHYAVSGKIAAELVIENVNGDEPYAGMKAFSKSEKEIKQEDLKVGRNYLEKDDLRKFEILYEQIILFIEMKTINNEKMTIAKWEHQIKEVILANGLDPFNQYSYQNLRPEANKKAALEFSKFKQRMKLEQKENKKIETKK